MLNHLLLLGPSKFRTGTFGLDAPLTFQGHLQLKPVTALRLVAIQVQRTWPRPGVKKAADARRRDELTPGKLLRYVLSARALQGRRLCHRHQGT